MKTETAPTREVVVRLSRTDLFRVVAYRVEREFGGHEEGGWWFDTREAVDVLVAGSEAAVAAGRVMLEARYPDTGKRDSVLGGNDYTVYTFHPGEESPYYESDYRPYE